MNGSVIGGTAGLNDYQGHQLKQQAIAQSYRQPDVRPASPVECELNRLTDELARMVGLTRSLMERLEPVRAVAPTAGQACGNAPYDGCQIGERINSAAATVRYIGDGLDACISSLQV